MEIRAEVIRGRQAGRLLLLVHGLGADERDMAGLVPHLDPGGRFVAVLPRAPFPAPPGWGWFDFAPGGVDPATFVVSLRLLDDLLDAACRQEGMARREAIAAGFSQGGILALALGLHRGNRPRPAGVLAMSALLAEADGLDYDWDDPGLPPVLLQHGLYDPVIPFFLGRAAATELEGSGVDVEFREYPMEHQVSLESLADARQWLEKVIDGRGR